MAGAETTSATEALTTPGEKKRLSKYVSRMKTVLRRADYSKRVSSSSMAPPVVASSATPAVEYVLEYHTHHCTSYMQGPLLIVDVLSTVETEPTSETAPAVTKPTIKQSNAARHLAQKYSIGLDISDWKITEVAERFEKPIRMRIHRTCHVCNTSYGTDRTCASCSHKRCKKCPRYPKKEAQGGKGKDVTCMDTNKIHATSSIEKAHEVGQRSSADVRHRKLPTPDEPLHLDEQQPLKEIPLMKRERTLQLLRIYIATLERVGHKYLDPTHYRGLPIGSEPSVTDCSSNGSIRSGASTLASVASTISRLRTSACSLEDDPEQESKSSRPLPEDLRARKALMRYIGCCAACSRRRTRVSISSLSQRQYQINHVTVSPKASRLSEPSERSQIG
jgi:hypothetical protein